MLASDETLTTAPPPWPAIRGTTARQQVRADRRLTSSDRCHSPGGVSSSPPGLASADVVVQDRGDAERLGAPLDHGRHRVGVGGVGLHGHGPASGVLDGAGDASGLVAVEVDGDDGGALGGEGPRRGLAVAHRRAARPGADDDGDRALELTGTCDHPAPPRAPGGTLLPPPPRLRSPPGRGHRPTAEAARSRSSLCRIRA